MTPKHWRAFKRAMDPTFKAMLPCTDLHRRISATDGASLSREQYEELRRMDTDVVSLQGKQYALCNGAYGPKLHRLLLPVVPLRQERRAAPKRTVAVLA